MKTNMIGMKLKQLETPVATVDVDQLQENIGGLQIYLDKHNIANRPHIKTHKIPDIAHMQMDAGAVGITCQTLREAEVMAQAGIKDIFLPYNFIGEQKLDRLMHLTRIATVSVTADSHVVVQGLIGAAKKEGIVLTVLVEFDTGGQRCGVQSPSEAVELVACIADSDSLHFGGLMTYPCNDNTDSFVGETKDLLEPEGLLIERVSVGGTPVMWNAASHPEITEYRAGMYIYGDRYLIEAGAMQLEDCAFRVITTVVSRPTADRGILDAGSKTLAADIKGLVGHGLIVEYPLANIYQLSEEHGHVDFSNCKKKPRIGERLTLIPNHCCVVNNLFNKIIGLRHGEVDIIWQVKARGELH